MTPYKKKDFRSHAVPRSVYVGQGGLEINSFPLCRLLASSQGWNLSHSYRIPGTVYSKQKIVVFQLSKAIDINV